jgi:ribosomal protein S18 acetylase RimI-like enzyme
MGSSAVRIGVVCKDIGFRHRILRIRQWCDPNSRPISQGPLCTFVPEFREPKAGVGWLRESPGDRILIAIGFKWSEIEDDMSPDAFGPQELRRLEMILFLPEGYPEWDELETNDPSASLLSCTRCVTRVRLREALRKSILRARAKQYVRPRVLESDDDLERYFRLRYLVWKELGYLAQEKDVPQIGWELDYTDRTSLPLGLFAADGSLVACGRLVRGIGEEYPGYVARINRLIEASGRRAARDWFAYPSYRMTQPFDVLEAFERFPQYYRGLVRGELFKAELSRVIVRPEDRRRGLGEALVDSLVSLARAHGTDLLFLACRKEHGRFYRKCGFRAIPEMAADRFLRIQTPVIAMDRPLGGAAVMARAER